MTCYPKLKSIIHSFNCSCSFPQDGLNAMTEEPLCPVIIVIIIIVIIFYHYYYHDFYYFYYYYYYYYHVRILQFRLSELVLLSKTKTSAYKLISWKLNENKSGKQYIKLKTKDKTCMTIFKKKLAGITRENIT